MTLAVKAQLVKRVNGFEKYKKWAKLDPCFSFNKGIRDAGSTADFRILFEMVMTHILHQQIFTTFFENKFGQN